MSIFRTKVNCVWSCSMIASYLGMTLFYEGLLSFITNLLAISRFMSFIRSLGYAMKPSHQLLSNLCVKMDSTRIDHAFCMYVKLD